MLFYLYLLWNSVIGSCVCQCQHVKASKILSITGCTSRASSGWGVLLQHGKDYPVIPTLHCRVATSSGQEPAPLRGGDRSGAGSRTEDQPSDMRPPAQGQEQVIWRLSARPAADGQRPKAGAARSGSGCL